MEADSPARQSKAAKALDRRREQDYGKPFHRTLLAKAPAVLAELEKCSTDRQRLGLVVLRLFGEFRPIAEAERELRRYLRQKHELLAEDYDEMTAAKVVEYLVGDLKAATVKRGRPPKQATDSDKRIIALHDAHNSPKEIVRAGFKIKDIRRVLGTQRKRKARARQKPRQE